MKKCGPEERRYSILVTRKRTKRKLRQKVKRLKLLKANAHWDYILQAPISITIQNPHYRSEILEFIRNLIRLSENNNIRILIDFTKTCQMVTDGTLLLRANLCKLINGLENVIIKCRLSRSNKINQVLHQ